MGLWDRIRAILRRPSPTPSLPVEARSARPDPKAPGLDEMRKLLRAGMTRDEFFAVLDDLAGERGLRISLPTNDDRLVALPVAEGGELLCFLPEGALNYVEYEGGIFLEKAEEK
jgi:hypothetical protein